jgi:hypothetical protein
MAVCLRVVRVVASKALVKLMKNSVSDFPGRKKQNINTQILARQSDVVPKIFACMRLFAA